MWGKPVAARRGWERVDTHCCAAMWSKNSERVRCCWLSAIGANVSVEVLLGAGDGDVEQPGLVLDGAAVAGRVVDRLVRDDVAKRDAAHDPGREPVLAHRGQEHRGPLQSLGLVDGRDRDRVRRGVADVGVRVGVVAGRLVVEPLGEPFVLLPSARS